MNDMGTVKYQYASYTGADEGQEIDCSGTATCVCAPTGNSGAAPTTPAKCDTIDLAFCAGTEHTGDLIADASCGGAMCGADDADNCCGVIYPVARGFAGDAASAAQSAAQSAQHAGNAGNAASAAQSAVQAAHAAVYAAGYARQATATQTNAAKAAKADAKAQAEAADASATAAAKSAAKAAVYAAIYAASEAAGVGLGGGGVGGVVGGVTSLVTLALEDLEESTKREVLKTVYNDVDCSL